MLDRAAGEALLAKLDEFAVELARFRAELIALIPPAMVNGAGAEGTHDFAEHRLIDPASAFVNVMGRSNCPGTQVQAWRWRKNFARSIPRMLRDLRRYESARAS